jgi:hypothetical protein
MIYKVSYVVRGGSHPGAILDAETVPKVGETVTFGGQEFRIIEVMELMPSRGGFGFLHATCVPVNPEGSDSA